MKHKVVYIILCIVMTMSTFLILHLHANNTEKSTLSTEVLKGQEKLKKETMKDTKQAEKAIRDVETQLVKQKAEKANRDKLPFYLRFQNTVILGDSMAEAFLDYRLLPTHIVLAIRGRRTDNATEEVTRAITLAPHTIFLSYGMNDLPYCRGNAKRFIEQYTQMIKRIKIALPDTRIFVSSIVPMTAYAYQAHPVMKHDKEFNKAIKTMCKQLKVNYIDNDALIDGHAKNYEQDGIHPKYPFYPVWLKHMAEAAGR